MTPSCCAGITGVNGSLNANFRMSSNDGGRRKSMISSLCAARVPSANTREAGAGGR